MVVGRSIKIYYLKIRVEEFDCELSQKEFGMSM
jgi:hypothetical protein